MLTASVNKTEKTAAKPLTLRGYAAHRGVSAPAVLRAIRAGRLSKSLVTGRDGKPKIVDVELADAEWAENTQMQLRAPRVKRPTVGPHKGQHDAAVEGIVTPADRLGVFLVGDSGCLALCLYRRSFSQPSDDDRMVILQPMVARQVALTLLGFADRIDGGKPEESGDVD